MINLHVKSLLALLVLTNAAFAADPLSSWNHTSPKKVIYPVAKR